MKITPTDTTQPLVICISGTMGSGKDTLAEKLSEKFTAETLVTSYGGGLKDELSEVIRLYNSGGIESFLQMLEDENIKVDDISKNRLFCLLEATQTASPPETPYTRSPHMRELLQTWGTDVRRRNSPNYWVDKVIENIEKENYQVIILTDVRFRNEMIPSERRNGFSIRLDVSRDKQEERLLKRDGFLPPESSFNHPSESFFPYTPNLRLNTDFYTEDEVLNMVVETLVRQMLVKEVAE